MFIWVNAIDTQQEDTIFYIFVKASFIMANFNKYLCPELVSLFKVIESNFLMEIKKEQQTFHIYIKNILWQKSQRVWNKLLIKF